MSLLRTRLPEPMHFSLRRVLALAAVVSAGVLGLIFAGGGCGRVAETKAADVINGLLPTYLGPADSWKTSIGADSAGAVLRGRLRTVHVEGTGVHLDPTLTADRLTLDFSDVAVDTRARRLDSVGSAVFSCRISSADLDRYVRLRRTDIRELGLSLRGDALFVRARPDVLGLGIARVPVEVEGILVPRGDGSLLDFDPSRARVAIIPVPGVVLDFLARRLNPAIDLSVLRVPIRITRSQVRGGYLYLDGAISPSDILRLAPK